MKTALIPAMSSTTLQPKLATRKRKKRNIGTFPCSDCDKIFSRSDHLARHYLNHQPKDVLICNFETVDRDGHRIKCGKTFVRKDLRERHMKRHLGVPMLIPGESQVETPLPLDAPQAVELRPPFSNPPMTAPEIPTTSHRNFYLHDQLFIQNNVQVKAEIVENTQNDSTIRSAHTIPNVPHVPNPPNVIREPSLPSGGLHMQQPLPPNYDLQSRSTYPVIDMSGNSPAQPHDLRGSIPYSKMHGSLMFQNMNGGALSNKFQSYPNSIFEANNFNKPLGQLNDPNFQGFNMQSADINPSNSNPGRTSQDILLWLFEDTVSRAPFKFSPDNFSTSPETPKSNFNEMARHKLHGTFAAEMSNLNLIPDTGPVFDDSVYNGFNVADQESFGHLSVKSSACSDLPTLTEAPKRFSDSIRSGDTSEHQNVQLAKFKYVNASILSALFDSLPQVSLALAERLLGVNGAGLENQFSLYLLRYWSTFHKTFPILHRPSFDTSKAEPLLLWNMILVGCLANISTEILSNSHAYSAEFTFLMAVARPLRFQLFQHEEFKSPVPVWVLQSLNILEWCEKNWLPREMHERAHLHHGTTVQLLRRSPFLGGNPDRVTKSTSGDVAESGGDEDSGTFSDELVSASENETSFANWVESESMKRLTFMTFILDAMDYIKFRHNPQISLFQLQLLNLPCDESSLWSSEKINGSFEGVLSRTKKIHSLKRNTSDIQPGSNFLRALKNLMKYQRKGGQKRTISAFTKLILSSGLISVMHQVQQADLQKRLTWVLPSDRLSFLYCQQWKMTLALAFDILEADFEVSHSSHTKCASLNSSSLYEVTQIIGLGDLNHYDIAIFSGSPQNMSVIASDGDLQLVRQKMATTWSKLGKPLLAQDQINARSVVHSIWVLSRVFQPSSTSAEYSTRVWSPVHDVREFMYAASVAMLNLWCCVYSIHGVESDKRVNLLYSDSYDKLIQYSSEDGVHYLLRIMEELQSLAKAANALSPLPAEPRKCSSGTELTQVINTHCGLLMNLTNMHHISGLCFLVSKVLSQSQWIIMRENAKLIFNCGLRSLGNVNSICSDLFEDDFRV